MSSHDNKTTIAAEEVSEMDHTLIRISTLAIPIIIAALPLLYALLPEINEAIIKYRKHRKYWKNQRELWSA